MININFEKLAQDHQVDINIIKTFFDNIDSDHDYYDITGKLVLAAQNYNWDINTITAINKGIKKMFRGRKT